MSDPLTVAEQVLERAGLLPQLVTDRDSGQAFPPHSRHSRQGSNLGVSGTTGTTEPATVTYSDATVTDSNSKVTDSDERRVRLTPASAVPLRRVTSALRARVGAVA